MRRKAPAAFPTYDKQPCGHREVEDRIGMPVIGPH